MSLLNQMLQDLDARRAAHGVGVRLPSDVRPLPAAPASRLPLILAVVLICTLVVGVVLYLREERAPPVPPQAAPATAPALPPAPAAANPAVPERGVAADGKESGPPETKPGEDALRLAEIIEAPADEAKTRPPLPRSASTARAGMAATKPARDGARSVAARRASAGGQAPATSAPPPAALSSAKSTASPTIEKSDPVVLPRERAELAYRKAIATLNQGRLDEAVDGLRTALRQDELHIGARQLLVRLLLESKRTDEAMQVLHEGLLGQPAQIGWAMSLGRLQADRGDLEAAWQTLDHSAPAAANNADYQGFAAHVLQRLARHKEAAVHYLAATRLAPGDGRWWLGLGLALDAEGRSGEAREAFLRARQSGTLNADLAAMVEQKLR